MFRYLVRPKSCQYSPTDTYKTGWQWMPILNLVNYARGREPLNLQFHFHRARPHNTNTYTIINT